MPINQDLAFAKELAKYKDKWIALQDKRVVASGNSVREVQEEVARKKITDFAFHYVPSKRRAMAGGTLEHNMLEAQLVPSPSNAILTLLPQCPQARSLSALAGYAAVAQQALLRR